MGLPGKAFPGVSLVGVPGLRPAGWGSGVYSDDNPCGYKWAQPVCSEGGEGTPASSPVFVVHTCWPSFSIDDVGVVLP